MELAHIRALDGLRGAAVAGVVLFHAGHLQGGFLGVDLFFVLSGYLITSLLLAESTRSGAIRLGAFWARRARRLLPALVLLLVGVSGYCLVLAQPAELSQIRGDALATVGYFAVTRARTAPVGTRRVMVIGDSVGWYLGDAMAGVRTTPPQIVANLSLLACVFPSGASAVTYTATGETRSDPPSCDAKWDDALRTFRPEVVVMFGWVEGQVEYEYGGSTERPCDPQYLHRVRDQLTDVAHRVARRGVRFVITTYPETPSDALSTVATRAVACVNAVRREVARRTGSQLVDLARLVCPPGRGCVTQVFGLTLRPDGVHFRGPAAPGVAKWVLTQIGGGVGRLAGPALSPPR